MPHAANSGAPRPEEPTVVVAPPPHSALDTTPLTELAAAEPQPAPPVAPVTPEEPQRGLTYHEYIEAQRQVPPSEPSWTSKIVGVLSNAMFYVICAVIVALILGFVGIGSLRALLARLLQH